MGQDRFLVKWNLTTSPIHNLLVAGQSSDTQKLLNYNWVNPPFSRQLIANSYGKLALETKLPNINKIRESHKYFFLDDSFTLDKKIFKKVLSFSGIGRFLLFRRGDDFKVFKTGMFYGARARFNVHSLQKNEVYITGSGNPEIDSYIKANTSGFKNVDIEKIKTSSVPIVFDHFNKEAIKNKKFLKAYEECQINEPSYIGDKDYNSFSIFYSDLEKTICNEFWCEKNKIPEKFLCEYFGGVLVIDRKNTEELIECLSLLVKFSPKKIHKFVFNYFPFEGYEILPCLLFVGGLDEG